MKVWAFEVPPPGPGFETMTRKSPATVRSLAGIEAVSSMLLTKIVIRSNPLNRTTDVGTKFVPFTVKGKPEPAAVAVVGEMLVVVGTGLFTVKD